MPSATATKQSLAHWLQNDAVFATSLLALLIDARGAEALNWDPETIRLELTDMGGGTGPTRENFDKLMALISALTTDRFYKDPEVFMRISTALCGSGINADWLDVMEAEEAAWGITEVCINDPLRRGEKSTDRFSEDIRKMLGLFLADEGIQHPPDVLGIAIMPDKMAKVDQTFGDDPELFHGFYLEARNKEMGVKTFVLSQMKELIQQLNQLPLEHRNEQAWSQFVGKQRWLGTSPQLQPAQA